MPELHHCPGACCRRKRPPRRPSLRSDVFLTSGQHVCGKQLSRRVSAYAAAEDQMGAVKVHLLPQGSGVLCGVCADLIGVRRPPAADLLDLNIGISIHDLVVPTALSETVERRGLRLGVKRRGDGVSEHSGFCVPPALRRTVLACAIPPERPESLVADFVPHVERIGCATHVRLPKHKKHSHALREVDRWRGHAVAIQPVEEGPVIWRVFQSIEDRVLSCPQFTWR